MFEDKALANWLEESIKAIVNGNAESIVIAFKPAGKPVEIKYHNASPLDLVMFGTAIQFETMLESIENLREQNNLESEE